MPTAETDQNLDTFSLPIFIILKAIGLDIHTTFQSKSNNFY